jgi:hypothetical protein
MKVTIDEKEYEALREVYERASAFCQYFVRPNVPGWGIEALVFQRRAKELAYDLDKAVRAYEEVSERDKGE